MSLDEQLIKAVRRRSMNSEEYKKNIEDIQSLLVQGASANAVDYRGFHNPTVLLRAAEEGKKEVVELLLEYGANINNGGHKREPTETPLHGAIEKKHEEVAIFLIENGANIHAKNLWGSTPLEPVRDLGRMIRWI